MVRLTLWALLSLTFVTWVSTIAIKGPQGGVDVLTGERPLRQEFSVFKDSGPAFDLYIQSLRHFMQQNQSSLLSYYSVSGIHGYPHRAWNGVDGGYDAGYCPHGSILFPPWHRPYLALFEQILWKTAQNIARRYPLSQRRQYQEAAKTLRIPYWDWALSSRMPDLTNTRWITINAPHGRRNVSNPLYEYTFHPQPSAADFPPDDSTQVSLYHHSVRYPDAAGNSQPELSNLQLVKNGQGLHDQTYKLIAEASGYGPFSNNVDDDLGNHYLSLETIHDGIHGMVGGGGGHMSFIPYSSFDPIFWLHHANVDRLFAIWQAIYPDSYAKPQVSDFGTFTNAPGSLEDTNTPLTPFHSNDDGTLYTSTTARSTRTFGYTYPEVIDWNVNSSQLASNVRTRFNALYNPFRNDTLSSLKKRSKVAAQYLNATDHQWFVNIRVDRSAISSFFIHFFLGSIPVSPQTWSFASTLVASHSVLAPASSISRSSPVTSYGQISLTHALVSSPEISCLDPDIVVPFVTRKLSWRIQKFDGSVLDVGEVPSLRLYVAGQTVRQCARADEFPVYGPLVAYRSVTSGKQGCLGEEDPL
ncbi:hypothetical protein MMC22_002066 [Lobaria immixta]|nr:hypothetical protein [Lobaria immixta]